MSEPDFRASYTDKALEAFSDYFRRNYPGPDTIIHKPDWHAPKLFRAAAAAIAHYAAPAPVPTEGGPSVADCLRSEIDVVESCAGFMDESTPAGEAWATILQTMKRSRCGNPAPVPVAERPWEQEGWCNIDGLCALFDSFDSSWRMADPLNDPAQWYSHSLPHWALPIPETVK